MGTTKSDTTNGTGAHPSHRSRYNRGRHTIHHFICRLIGHRWWSLDVVSRDLARYISQDSTCTRCGARRSIPA